MQGDQVTNEFERETGALTARRCRAALLLYLLFATTGAVPELGVYPARAPLLLPALAAQALVVAIVLLAMRGPIAHPKSAWIVLLAAVSLCAVVAVYNAAVHGDMLYVLLVYMSFMLVTAMIIPWGAGFQFAMNCGIIAAYSLALARGARTGPVPAYDFISIAAVTMISAIGAYHVDEYRRQLFAQTTALRTANRNLEAANRARTELLSGLSHDMRTPLSVLLGYAEILAEEPSLSSHLRHPVRAIGREAQELLYLVDSVLDLARLESGHLPFHRSTFRLAELLRPLRETTEDLLRNRNVRLRWDIPDTVTIDSDEGKVREIVRNLLSNAVKFTEEGEIAVSCAPRNGGTNVIVADTGAGIAPEHLHVIFNAFQQVTVNPGAQQSGSGFGLYMVKLLVALVGGTIDVQSVPHGGSTFRVWLPPRPPGSVGGAAS